MWYVGKIFQNTSISNLLICTRIRGVRDVSFPKYSAHLPDGVMPYPPDDKFATGECTWSML